MGTTMHIIWPIIAALFVYVLAHFRPCPPQSDGEAMWLLIMGAFLFVMAPSALAFLRHHRYRWPLLFVNISLGGTGLGLIGCWVWALCPHSREEVAARKLEKESLANEEWRVDKWLPKPLFSSKKGKNR
jgi:hypothetical protein